MTNIGRLEKILEKIPKDKKHEADLLANELRFIIGECENLQKDIKANGCVEEFKQGKQEFLRESPYLTAYNKLMKTYDTFFKSLMNLVPKEALMSDDAIDEKFFK